MRIMKEPYFLINDEYWYYDKEECKFKLTEKGLKSKKALDSYNEFYNELEGGEQDDETN